MCYLNRRRLPSMCMNQTHPGHSPLQFGISLFNQGVIRQKAVMFGHFSTKSAPSGWSQKSSDEMKSGLQYWQVPPYLVLPEGLPLLPSVSLGIGIALNDDKPHFSSDGNAKPQHHKVLLFPCNFLPPPPQIVWTESRLPHHHPFQIKKKKLSSWKPHLAVFHWCIRCLLGLGCQFSSQVVWAHCK